MILTSENSKTLCEVVYASVFRGEIRDVNVSNSNVAHVIFSSREMTRYLLKMRFSLVNDEFQPSTFPIG